MFKLLQERLLHLYNCRRVFNLNPHENLVHYAYWLRESDKRLHKVEHLKSLPLENIYGVYKFNLYFQIWKHVEVI